MANQNKQGPEFSEQDAQERDRILKNLLRTPPEHRPKRERKNKPESVAEKGTRR